MEHEGGMMNKLIILMFYLLLVAGGVSPAWAHGPSGEGARGYGHSYSKSSFHKSSRTQMGGLFRHHRRKSLHKSSPHFRRKAQLHRGFHSGPHRKLHVEKGVISGKRHLRRKRGFYYPLVRSRFYRNFGVRLQRRRAPQEKEFQEAPQPDYSSQIYYDKNPNPWFLYGKGDEFRQMGLIPPLFPAFRGLE